MIRFYSNLVKYFLSFHCYHFIIHHLHFANKINYKFGNLLDQVHFYLQFNYFFLTVIIDRFIFLIIN